jgi:2-methylcitrate dehydratase PrpD
VLKCTVDNPLLRLSEHGAAWRLHTLSPELERHARRALIDWTACLLSGCSQTPAVLLARALADERGVGSACCYVDGHTTNMRHAALLNAVATHSTEFDDIFRDAGYHPGAPTISAALAAAQARGASLTRLLLALVSGYEVSCRIALAVQPSHYRYWHTTATVGTMGSAAATASILGLDAAKTAHALATAATAAAGLQQAFRGEGMSKPLHAGHAADAGIVAALAAASGVTGALDILHGPVGFAAATSRDTGDWEAALSGLQAPPDLVAPMITRITFKNHGCCGHIFPALDGIEALRRSHGFTTDEIAAIHVAGYSQTKDICDRETIETEQDARFSLQYCVAALLMLGSVRLEAFAPEHLNDAQLRRFMTKVSVSCDPDLAAAYPGHRQARITVSLNDGTRFSYFQPTRKGDPDAPLSDDELSEKFTELAEPVIGAAAAGKLLAQLWMGNELPGPLELLMPFERAGSGT